ncbi:Hydantoinase B/oxoprolinase [Microstroma glucosiphilum]|uniref:Hydantoinase B/oxoprolinase n=1 Tax=Pseudomicrostroma glucosiphilum TaxID=1684307 RepID=A0A316U3B9_9BASI|nr:Hydantoinase B/oxoprolinase [Pseudomicrostroma glucosiphilum]PWN19294.1 Hydantoinase B/oxoprolinase [Pseudomicrostroma glucosiphilum]
MSSSSPSSSSSAQKDADPILLSVFSNRFSSIADAMGRTLEQTSISVNVKLRLDFSCALFGPDGSLVANAPNLPVHLGSMSFAVAYQIDYLGIAGIKKGDVIMANHPAAGGSHLPDITIISPCFSEKGEIIFFVASRAHHADIGGVSPGSMPPHSKTLHEEGAQIKSFKIVEGGKYNRDGVVKHLLEDPAQYPGCSGTRCLRDVESDLQAQIAANQKGINLLNVLIDEWGLQMVQDYMMYIRSNAELSVRNLLKEVAKRQETTYLYAKDYMDDGSPIELKITIDEKDGSAFFDFEGTGPEVLGNWNCPKSVCYSAIIYCLRCMVAVDIPLNQGCLAPVTVKIPEGSLLDPSDNAAVVGGNVLTSQRITDIVLKAFKAAAASQGDCNNLTFGMGGSDKDGKHVDGFGYYETIAGGSGAGPDWQGTDGVHVAMTNTRATDVETLERNYPVVLRRFEIRDGSGGVGRNRGGNGVTKELQFLTPQMQVSILSERRVYHPFGLEGGGDAECGRNTWIKHEMDKDGKTQVQKRINLGGKASTMMSRGDRIIIETPGGGGWGAPDSSKAGSDRNTGDEPAGILHSGLLKGSLVERVANQLGV